MYWRIGRTNPCVKRTTEKSSENYTAAYESGRRSVKVEVVVVVVVTSRFVYIARAKYGRVRACTRDRFCLIRRSPMCRTLSVGAFLDASTVFRTDIPPGAPNINDARPIDGVVYPNATCSSFKRFKRSYFVRRVLKTRPTDRSRVQPNRLESTECPALN